MDYFLLVHPVCTDLLSLSTDYIGVLVELHILLVHIITQWLLLDVNGQNCTRLKFYKPVLSADADNRNGLECK